LVDTVGELGAWWGTAAIAFVGGSLGDRGGQNMIEPAAYGAAVSFGPNTRNFRDIVSALLARDAAVVVSDADELAQFVRRCLQEPDYAAALGARAKALVLEQLGAAGRTFRLLAELIEQPEAAGLRPMLPHQRPMGLVPEKMAVPGVSNPLHGSKTNGYNKCFG
jgi:3-deoxy-D-manno-octulosonic-acid transferase